MSDKNVHEIELTDFQKQVTENLVECVVEQELQVRDDEGHYGGTKADKIKEVNKKSVYTENEGTRVEIEVTHKRAKDQCFLENLDKHNYTPYWIGYNEGDIIASFKINKVDYTLKVTQP